VKKGFNLIDNLIGLTITLAIVGVIASIVIPTYFKIKKDREMREMSPEQRSQDERDKIGFTKVCEADGYNIYRIYGDRGWDHYIAIPKTNKTNSVESVEK